MLHFPPLKDRVIRTRDTHALAPPVIPSSRPFACKCYSEFQLEKATEAVLHEKLSVRRAALLYSVPRSTLSDHISGRALPGTVSGPRSYLSSAEEAELATFLTRCSMMGYAKSKSEVIALVQK